MASDSPGVYRRTQHMTDGQDGQELFPGASGTKGSYQGGGASGGFVARDSGYYVSTSDGASTCSSSTTETGEGEGGTLLVLEPKSLRSFTTNDEYLYAMKEDLADWFSCLYQNDDITAENFFQVLETGVLLCRHANKVQEFSRQRREKGESLEMRSYFIRSVPEGNVPFREGVKPETFQARDNVSNFIRWGRQLGIPEVLSFETDDLVLRKNEKSVILCLLEIARVGAKLGMLAPTLVQMEQEIDAELAGEEPKPQVQIKTCDMRSLDERVRDLIGRCTCPMQFPMIKVGEGKYKIGDSRSLIFVRILRNHVMVRVGGGWDTLENYLNKHDPCQCMYRGHRAGGTAPITHKITVNQQRRASTPGNSAQRPAPNTPTSPRRMSAAVAAPERNRSASPQTAVGAQNRSKSPTLMISRSAVTPSKGAVFGSPAPEHKNLRGAASQPQQGVANKTSSNSNTSFNNSSPSQPVRCKSPSPGRLRSPSPLTTSQSAVPRPNVLRTSSSSVLLKGKDVGGDNRTTTPRKISQGILSRSVSFDERAELPSVARSSSSSLERVSESESVSSADGGGKSNVSMDKISTMTLSEFKSLLNSALSVPEEQQLQQQLQQQQQQNVSDRGGGRSPGQSSQGDQNRPLNWDSLREKARSVRDSISSSVTSRRAGNSPGEGGGRSAGSYGVIGRRSLPQSPDEDRGRPATAMGIERPKTPKALRRNVDTSNAISRPKTPTSSIGRPKTPSRLERTGPPKEEYKMSRPKTPSQLKRDAVAKVAGAISNWVESRNEMDSSSAYGNNNRPKTPTRSKTPVGSRSNMSQKSMDDYDDDDDDNSEVAGVLANPQVQTIASTVRERPSTPSRIPKPCFTPRPSTPKALSSLAIDSPREDRSPSNAPTSHPPTRPNTVSATRPSLICRSNSNSSSVKSFDETTPSSPASSCGDDKSLRSSLSQSKSGGPSARKLPNVSESNSNANTGRSYKDIYTAKRSAAGFSEARPQPSRAVTPGPREKWTIGGGGGGCDDGRGGTSSTASTPGTRRRGSLNTICQTEKPAILKKPNFSGSQHRGTPRAPEVEPDQGMSITNEITFSDDEEINELVKNAALKAKMCNPEKRVRSASVDARRLVRQNAREKKEEVLMISRDRSGHHGVQVVKNNEIKYTSTPKSSVVKRPSSRGSSTDRSTPVANASRFRSQTPEPYMFRQKISTPKTKGSNEAESVGASSRNGEKGLNRTEAWVDSTLSDTKRKLPPRPKRAKGFGNDIPPSELEPRPLEEIKAILAEPKNGYVHVEAGNMDVPAEDPEMFRKMEKLFEKYREMELKASVNETPGNGNGAAVPADKSADSQSVKGGSQGSGHAASRSTPSVASMKTSSGDSSGVSSGNSDGVTLRNTSSSRDENRFKRSSSVPGSFQIQKSSSNNSSTLNSPSQEVKDFVSSSSTYQNGSVSQSGRGSGSSSGDHHKGHGSLRDIDPEVAKNPTALISKIKEILQVRPRKDENSRVKTRIPAPAGLNKYARSKSVSNLCSDGDNGLSLKQSVGRSVLNHTNHSNNNNHNNHHNNNKTLSKSNSTSSGNIAYSEYVFTDDAADEVPELARTMSVQSDPSDSQNRSETPIPKLAMPLTTGRSTLISRRGERFGRGLSQDKENNLSNSQSSLSSRSVLSATEDEADFV